MILPLFGGAWAAALGVCGLAELPWAPAGAVSAEHDAELAEASGPRVDKPLWQ